MKLGISYLDVNALLQVLLSNIQTTLGDYFIRMYLHGSLAIGDFDPQRSDIDYLVVTSTDLPTEAISALEIMHSRITSSELKW